MNALMSMSSSMASVPTEVQEAGQPAQDSESRTSLLPPRKRAKTENEKEQRRVERLLRNRRAAQSSRERKRQEVEALAAETVEKEQIIEALEAKVLERDRKIGVLEIQLADAQTKIIELQHQDLGGEKRRNGNEVRDDQAESARIVMHEPVKQESSSQTGWDRDQGKK